jgi:hypothetical protein
MQTGLTSKAPGGEKEAERGQRKYSSMEKRQGTQSPGKTESEGGRPGELEVKSRPWNLNQKRPVPEVRDPPAAQTPAFPFPKARG